VDFSWRRGRVAYSIGWRKVCLSWSIPLLMLVFPRLRIAGGGGIRMDVFRLNPRSFRFQKNWFWDLTSCLLKLRFQQHLGESGSFKGVSFLLEITL
jgi:hypothetical protein